MTLTSFIIFEALNASSIIINMRILECAAGCLSCMLCTFIEKHRVISATAKSPKASERASKQTNIVIEGRREICSNQFWDLRDQGSVMEGS